MSKQNKQERYHRPPITPSNRHVQSGNRPTLGSLLSEWLTPEEAMIALNISAVTLDRYRHRGSLGYTRIGYKTFYKASDIQALLERHYTPSKNDSHEPQ